MFGSVLFAVLLLVVPVDARHNGHTSKFKHMEEAELLEDEYMGRYDKLYSRLNKMLRRYTEQEYKAADDMIKKFKRAGSRGMDNWVSDAREKVKESQGQISAIRYLMKKYTEAKRRAHPAPAWYR